MSTKINSLTSTPHKGVEEMPEYSVQFVLRYGIYNTQRMLTPSCCSTTSCVLWSHWTNSSQEGRKM